MDYRQKFGDPGEVVEGLVNESLKSGESSYFITWLTLNSHSPMGATHLMMLSRNLGHQHAVNTKMMTSSILIICFLLLLILFVLFTVLVLCCTMKIL